MEKPKHRLQIIIDDSRSRTFDHAKRSIRHLEKQQWKGYSPVIPIGVSAEIAVFPNRCDDCGEMFWANNEYATHLKCKSGPKVGFG